MRRKFLLTAGLLLLSIAFVIFWLAPPTDPINAANFDRIEVGMTEQEVVQVLGPRDPDDEDIQREVQGDWRSDVKCWSRPSRGTIRDTILVCFRFQDGQWIVENKYCFIPSAPSRLKIGVADFVAFGETCAHKEVPHEQEVRCASVR